MGAATDGDKGTIYARHDDKRREGDVMDLKEALCIAIDMLDEQPESTPLERKQASELLGALMDVLDSKLRWTSRNLPAARS